MNANRGRCDAVSANANSNHKLNFEQTARRLIATNLPDALRCATDIRERIEIVHTSEYANFLRYLFPAFRNVLLHSSSMPMRANETETRFRHIILEILNRLPNNEVLRPYAPELLRVATDTLSRDSEENSLTCLRIVFDLHKNFRPALEGEVQSFLDLVQRIYRLLPTSINKAFAFSLQAHQTKQKGSTSNNSASNTFHRQTALLTCDPYLNPVLRIPGSKPASVIGSIPETVSALAPPSVLQGLDSFKVLTECPLIVMLLFQLYPKYIQDNIPLLTPLMMGGLALRAPAAAYKLQRERYREFVACQVKTLSFLTYLLRGFSELMKPYEEAISKAVIALMIACPGDAVATRKELLVATRHILATEFRRGFYRHVDILLDEKVLIGLGRASRDTLRPLAFSTLADLVHHVRAELKLCQLSRVVLLFSRNLHDPRLPLNVQTTSVRLLLNLVDFIFHNKETDPTKGRHLLVVVLQTLVSKFDTLRSLMQKIDSVDDTLDPHTTGHCIESTKLDVSREEHPDMKGHFGCSSVVLSRKLDSMTDVKPLMQTLIRGLKTVMWCISHYQQNQLSCGPQQKMSTSADSLKINRNTVVESQARATLRKPVYLLSQNETETISLFFYWGLMCCHVIAYRFEIHRFELKEILDNFAGAFTVLESFNFRSTVGQHIPMLFDAMLVSPALLAIAQTLLANSNVSATFANMLVAFLLGKLSNLSRFHFPYEVHHHTLQPANPLFGPNAITSAEGFEFATRVSSCLGASTLLRLLRIILGSVALFPKNEVILRGRLRVLTLACLQHAAAADCPVAYYFLLRSIFRSISNSVSSRGIRSELDDTAYFILNILLQLRLHADEMTIAHSILTELCMTVPMSPTALVTLIPRLLPVLAEALQTMSGDLPSLALRTLEYYLDHFGSTCICAVLACQPRLRYIMLIGVCGHLKPAPYILGTIALRILGKLGGRNRHFLELIGDSFPHLLQSGERYDSNGAEVSFLEGNHENDAMMHPRLFPFRIIMRWRGISSVLQPNMQRAFFDECFTLDIDSYLTDTCQLFNTLVRLSLVEQNFELSSIQNHPPLVIRYQAICFRLLASALCSLFKLPVQPEIPKQLLEVPRRERSPRISILQETGKGMKARGYDSSNMRLCRLLYSIICGAAHRELEAEATPLLQSCGFLFAILHCMSSMLPFDISDDPQPGEPRKRRNMHALESLSLHAFTSTLLAAATDCCSLVASTALGALKYFLGCIYSLELHVLEVPQKSGSVLITDVITRVCMSLHEWDSQSRKSVCEALHQLLTTFGHTLVSPNKDLLAAALLRALGDETDTALLSHNSIIQVLHALLQASHETTHAASLAKTLVQELASTAAAVRLGAQSGLIELNRLSNLPEVSSKILVPIAADSAHTLTKYHLRSHAPSDCTIGALDALNYMLSLRPPVIIPNAALHNCVLSILKKGHCLLAADAHQRSANWNTDIGWMSRSSFFSSAIDHSILCHTTSSTVTRADFLCAVAARTLHGSVRAARSIAFKAATVAPCQLARARYDGALFGCIPLALLHDTLDQALVSAKYSDVHIITIVSSSLLREVLALGQLPLARACSAYLSPILKPMELTSVTLQYLENLNRLISLPILHEVDTAKIALHLLNHLQEFCCLDRVAAIRSWMVGTPLEIAAKILHLISRLLSGEVDKSIETSFVLKSTITTVLELETVLSDCFDRDLNEVITLQNTMHLFSSHSGPELRTPRLGPSPFRFALARLLSRQARAATHFFLTASNIMKSDHVALLRFLVSIREASELRDRVMSAEGIELLLNAAFQRPLSSIVQRSHVHEHMKALHCNATVPKSAGNHHPMLVHTPVRHSTPVASAQNGLQTDAQFFGLQLMMVLHHLDGNLFRRHRAAGRCIIMLWRSRESLPKSSQRQASPTHDEFILRHHQETFLMIQGLVGYCRSYQEDVQVLFDTLSVFMTQSPVDFTFLKDFYREEVAVTWKLRNKRKLLVFFLRTLVDQHVAMELKVAALRLVITPMLISTFTEENKRVKPLAPQAKSELEASCVIDPEMLGLFMRSALDTANRQTRNYSEALRVELLKLTTILIEYLGQELVEHRKDLIKFAWNHLKSDDSLSKQWAYVNVCRFVATYETPPKIILQVYVALLRTFQPEARELVKVALDILIPALPHRLPVTDFVKAIKWTKKIMYEEGHALAQLVHMWQLVVRHPSLFYPYRSQFMPQMVNSLNRLGLPPNCPVENRQLAVALADLIITWELHLVDHVSNTDCAANSQFLTQKLESPGWQKHPIASAPMQRSVTSASTHLDDEFHLTTTMIEMVANFLVRLALFASDNKEPAVQRLAPRCLLLFKSAFKIWPSVHIRFSYFEKLIATSNTRLDVSSNDSPYSPTLLATCLDVIYITLSAGLQPNTFFIDNLAKAQQLICPCFDVSNTEIQTKLRKVIARISQLYPPSVPSSAITFFYHQVKCVLESRLSGVIETYCSLRQGMKPSHFLKAPVTMPLIRVVDSICKYMPAYILNHGYSLLRVTQIFVCQHLNTILRGRSSQASICHATPTMSVLASAVRSGLKLGETEHVEDKNGSTTSGEVITTLCSSILLLAQAVTDNILAGIRRELVVVVFVCLERSKSTELLLCVSKLASVWLTSVKSPLSMREKVAFVDHIANIDHLTEPALQPLLGHTLNIVERISRRRVLRKESSDDITACRTKRCDRVRCQNLITSGLLALHSSARMKFRGMLMQGIANSLSHHLVHMFQFDWSPLANRFWLVIVIEFMLDGLDVAGPIKLQTGTRTLPALPCKHTNEAIPLLACTNAALQHQYCAAYSHLKKRRKSLRHIVEPLKELTHAHLRLAERVWEDLLPRVFCNAQHEQRHQCEAVLAGAIFKQFIAPYHQPKLRVPVLLPSDCQSTEPFDKRPQYWTKPYLSAAFQPASSCSKDSASPHTCLSFDSMESIIPPYNVPRVLIHACYYVLPKCLAISDVGAVPVTSLTAAASKYNCRHHALRIMEEVVIEQQRFAGRPLVHNPRTSCALIFSELSEPDLRLNAMDASCTHSMSSAAFALRCYGFIPQAQQMFFNNMIKGLSLAAQHRGCSNTSTPAAVFETDVWCNEWLECARDMSQWSLLVDLLDHFAPHSHQSANLNMPELQLEAAWKIHKWDDVQQTLIQKAQAAKSANRISTYTGKLAHVSPQIKLMETRLAIIDGRYSDVEHLCGECIQLALNAWCNLPRPRLGLASHDSLLHLFHELIEVHESGQLLHESMQHSCARTYPDLRTVSHTWRERLPNDWDSLSKWDDIMRWREHVFLSVQKAFSSWGAADQISQLHDAPWTVGMLARVARKQGLVQVVQAMNLCSDEPKKCNDIRMNVNDAFSRLRERILAYVMNGDLSTHDKLNIVARTRAQAGLYLIKNTAMDLFYAEQRSELLRLKGLFLGVLGQYRDAHSSFSAATCACSTYGRAWYSWAALCDENSSMKLSSNLTNHLVENSFMCYLAAVECGYKPAFVCGLARVLRLLRLDKHQAELSQKFHKQMHGIPIPVWVPWIPQLILMLNLCDVRVVLFSLARALPQAVYYSLQPHLLSDVNHMLEPSSLRANQVISHIQMSNTRLAAELDTLRDEIVLGVKPSPAKELFYMMWSILQRCRGFSSETGCEGTWKVYQLLHKISTRHTGEPGFDFFHHRTSWGEMSASQDAAPNFIIRNGISTSGASNFASLQATMERLKQWIAILRSHSITPSCENSLFCTISKYQYERKYSECCYSGVFPRTPFVEIPGQYAHSFDKLRPELHLPFLKFEASNNIRIRRGRVLRHLAFIADQGRVRSLVPSVTSANYGHTSERVCQFFGIVDFALTQCSNAQRRRLRASPIASIQIAPHVQLSEDRWSWTSLHEVNESHSSMLGEDRDTQGVLEFGLIERSVTKLLDLNQPLRDTEHTVLRACYNRTCSTGIRADVLTTRMCANLDCMEAIWTYRRTFGMQLAIPSILGHILAVGNRNPHTTMFCQVSGRMSTVDFQPRLSLKSNELQLHLCEMPFRLTRNIERVLQPFLFNAVFKSSIGTILIALRHTLEPGGFLEPYLQLFLGDEHIHGCNPHVPVHVHILENMARITNRILKSAPPLAFPSCSACVETGLSNLVSHAIAPDNIATMPPLWQPWL